jgi:hypothetical protein
MAKALSDRRREIGPFERAALSGRFIGVAAMALAGLTLVAGRTPYHLVFAALFGVPGLLYFVLATWVARRRRWAIWITLLLAMADMMLLGLLFWLEVGAPGALIICALSGLFLAALSVLWMYLTKSLEALKRLGGGQTS